MVSINDFLIAAMGRREGEGEGEGEGVREEERRLGRSQLRCSWWVRLWVRGRSGGLDGLDGGRRCWCAVGILEIEEGLGFSLV